jgi:hypothetical protein
LDKSPDDAGAVDHGVGRLGGLHLDDVVFPLPQNVDVMVVVLVLLFVLIAEDHFLLALLDCRLEDLVRPLILATPVVLLGLVLEIVVADVRVPIRHANVNSFVLEHSGYFA